MEISMRYTNNLKVKMVGPIREAFTEGMKITRALCNDYECPNMERGYCHSTL
jgi:hypothetical protein